MVGGRDVNVHRRVRLIQYEKISGRLEVRSEAPDLDLLRLGILNSSLHEIFNLVALAIYEEANGREEEAGRQKLLDNIPQNMNRQDVLIRARIEGIRQGSIILDLQPLVAAVFSQPGAIAIVQNLAANVLWAIGQYGTKVTGVLIKWLNRRTGDGRTSGVLAIPSTTAHRRIRPRVEKLIEHLKESGNGGKISFKSGDEELTIEFYGADGGNRNRP